MEVITAGAVRDFKPPRVAEHPVRLGEDRGDYCRDTFEEYRYEVLGAACRGD